MVGIMEIEAPLPWNFFMTNVLVIVVVYNGMRWLSRCLGSVSNYDVLVVDNSSSDGSSEFVSNNFPQIELIRSDKNLGFTGGNNLGIKYAFDHGYDFVYLLNQDAWLEAGALDILLNKASSMPGFAVLSPLQMTNGYESLDHQFAKLYSSSKDEENTLGVKEVSRVMAAHWLVPVEAFRRIGLFSDLFPYYGQDDDWCNRARYHGWKIGIIPEARAVHDRAQRQELKESIIDRNYRVGSLVRLCDINIPLWNRFLFVILFTLVKTIKYSSALPLKHFIGICKLLPTIRAKRLEDKKCLP